MGITQAAEAAEGQWLASMKYLTQAARCRVWTLGPGLAATKPAPSCRTVATHLLCPWEGAGPVISQGLVLSGTKHASY